MVLNGNPDKAARKRLPRHLPLPATKRQFVGWITWCGTRPLYSDGTVGEPINT